MNNIILIGPPASGKGTQARLISEKYNIPHISVGALLREASLRNDEVGKYIKETIDKGDLVNEDVISDILNQRLVAPDCKDGYILDGYPRTLEQLKRYQTFLINNNISIGKAIFLDVPRDEALRRVKNRVTCPKCGKIFGEITTHHLDRCDVCNTPLSKRADDNEETFKHRYDIYINDTKPLIDYYKEQNILYIIDGMMSEEDIFNKIISIINN